MAKIAINGPKRLKKAKLGKRAKGRPLVLTLWGSPKERVSGDNSLAFTKGKGKGRACGDNPLIVSKGKGKWRSAATISWPFPKGGAR